MVTRQRRKAGVLDEATPLLGADEPAPVRVLRPDGASPFVLLADHAGRLIPRRLGTLGLTPADLDRHIAWDIGIAGVTERLSEAMDAACVMQAYSRLVIDCNRPPGVASSIPALSETTAIPGNTSVPATEAQARRTCLFDPYHTAIAALLNARAAAGRRTVLVSMHSFTPVYLGQARPMQVGMLYDGRDTRLAHALLALLEAEGDLVVGDNLPYAVSDATDYAVPVHGVARGLLHTAIEIRQDEVAEPSGQAAWSLRLARILPAAIEAGTRDG